MSLESFGRYGSEISRIYGARSAHFQLRIPSNQNSLLFQILTNYCRIFLWLYCVLREILCNNRNCKINSFISFTEASMNILALNIALKIMLLIYTLYIPIFQPSSFHCSRYCLYIDICWKNTVLRLRLRTEHSQNSIHRDRPISK